MEQQCLWDIKEKKLKRIFKRIFFLAIIDDEVGFEIGKKNLT